MTDKPMIDDFRGDNKHLVECMRALVSLNDAGALAPHGIGGHARSLLCAAASRIEAAEAKLEQAQKLIGEMYLRMADSYTTGNRISAMALEAVLNTDVKLPVHGYGAIAAGKGAG